MPALARTCVYVIENVSFLASFTLCALRVRHCDTHLVAVQGLVHVNGCLEEVYDFLLGLVAVVTGRLKGADAGAYALLVAIHSVCICH